MEDAIYSGADVGPNSRAQSSLIWAGLAVMQRNVLSHWTIRSELAALEDLSVLGDDEFRERLAPFAHEHLLIAVIQSHLLATPPILCRLEVHGVMPHCILMLVPQLVLALPASVDICFRAIIKPGNAIFLGCLVNAQAKHTWLLRPAECHAQ